MLRKKTMSLNKRYKSYIKKTMEHIIYTYAYTSRQWHRREEWFTYLRARINKDATLSIHKYVLRIQQTMPRVYIWSGVSLIRARDVDLRRAALSR